MGEPSPGGGGDVRERMAFRGKGEKREKRGWALGRRERKEGGERGKIRV